MMMFSAGGLMKKVTVFDGDEYVELLEMLNTSGVGERQVILTLDLGNEVEFSTFVGHLLVCARIQAGTLPHFPPRYRVLGGVCEFVAAKG